MVYLPLARPCQTHVLVVPTPECNRLQSYRMLRSTFALECYSLFHAPLGTLDAKSALTAGAASLRAYCDAPVVTPDAQIMHVAAKFCT